MAQHFSSPAVEEKHQVLTTSYLSFVRIKYELGATWVMRDGCSFKTGAFANLSVVTNLLSTCSGILGVVAKRAY